jgi:MFS transporter, PAT family, solute carrier family 33 (acetyl-CoA transportor), member 1
MPASKSPTSLPFGTNTSHDIPVTIARDHQHILPQQQHHAASQEDHELQDYPSSSLAQSDRESSRTVRKKNPDLRINRSSYAAVAPTDSEEEEDIEMGKKSKTKDAQSPALSTSSQVLESPNGHTTSAMNGMLEHRRKNASIDSASTASRANELMGRHSFTLDEPVPALTHDPDASTTGFWELPRQDRRNFLLLVLLYFLQGIPMGLATGSVPFLLKPHVSYSEIGVFSLASYPYSLKLLWSPIVDAVWSRKVGRRKSWILPIQTLSGFGMLVLGASVEKMMKDAESKDGPGVWGFTWWWFGLVFMCATQDIAVDGNVDVTIVATDVLTAI